MSQHTPGPWTQEYDGSLVMQGQVISGPFGPDGASAEELRANATLIAAAPESLKALHRCIAALKANGAPNCEAAKEARAAIAKAEGKAVSA